MKRVALLAVIALVTLFSIAHADNWPAWRGPNFNGVAPGNGYPTEWSESKNIVWKVALPGVGGSTPAVWEDRIFVTLGEEGQNTILCIDNQGQEIWKKQLGKEVPGKHKKGSGANPSPTTDGQHVYVYFKSGDLACLDFDGNIVWQHNLQERFGEDTLWWDLGTSPVLLNDLVIVATIHSGPSYIAAFHKSTGELAWKHDRDLPAPNESLQTYSTPIPTKVNGRDAIVVLGADHVTAHDAEDGREIWRLGGLNPGGEEFFRSIASPVVHAGVVVAPYARGGTLTAVPVDGKGDVTKNVLWVRDDISADVPTPAAHDGRIYVCNDKGKVACLDVNDGRTLWEGKVKIKSLSAYSASPIVADGKLYVTMEDGTITVLALGDEFKVLAENQIDEFIVATPVFVDGRILIRTDEHLYCLAQQ